MVRDKIVLRGQVIPKRVTLPDGRTFYTRYERVSRRNLPANVTIKRARAIEPRQQRKEKHGESDLHSSAFKLGSQLFKPSHITKGIDNGLKVLNSALGKKIIEEEIKQTPAIYTAGVKIIKIDNQIWQTTP